MTHIITDRERKVYLQDLRVLMSQLVDDEPYITNTFNKIEELRKDLLNGKYIRFTKPSN